MIAGRYGDELMQKLSYLIFWGILFFFFALSPSHGEEVVDRIIAVVNDDVITLSEMEDAAKDYFTRIKAQAPASEVDRILAKAREEVLSSMIDQFIVRQQAEKLSIAVSEKELDAALDQMLVRNNATIEDFRQELVAMNISEQEYRDNIRDEILKSKLIGYEVRSRIVITEDDIQAYYQKDIMPESGGNGFHLLQMGFTWRNSVVLEQAGFDSKESARKTAEEVRTRAVGGENFRTLAKEFSNLPSAADGGDIGFFTKDEMVPFMKNAIMAIQPGEISRIVENRNTFQFFKLLSVQEGDTVVKAPCETVREEIRDVLYQQEMEAQYKKWVTGLRDGAYIRILL
jgi:peptidyl-prolyl cis-trans isomerase SurA